MAEPKRQSSGGANAGIRRLWLPLVLITATAAAVVLFSMRGSPPTPNPRSDRERVHPALQTPAQTTVTQTTEQAVAAQMATVPLRNPRSWEQMDDPSADGWETEAFHQLAKKQLEKLGELVIRPNPVRANELAPLVAADFSCGPLLPHTLRPVYEDRALIVQRAFGRSGSPETITDQSGGSPATYSGAEGLAEAINDVCQPLTGAEDGRFEFKVFQVIPSPGEVTTRQYLTLVGHTSEGVAEQHATWVIRWTHGDGASAPRMKSIEVEDFEQTLTKTSPSPLFVDCTESVLAQNPSYDAQILRGVNYWWGRLPTHDPINRIAMPGVALGDVDGDGLDDLYLCQEPGLPNLLFLQNPDGTMRDVSDEWGVNWLEDSRAALLVDLDNDGDQDLVVATAGCLVVASNESQRGFRVQTALPTSQATVSLAAADYDEDGRLDLYCCVYGADKYFDETATVAIGAISEQFVYHDANNGGANSFFRNEIGDDNNWRFADVTKQVGLDVNNRRWSFAAAWEDFDNDGDQDLYVANDYGRNTLYRNDEKNGARGFVDVAAEAGAEDSASGMSVSWGDYDRDGQMDVYVSNMFSAAGNRIVPQANFKPETTTLVRGRFERFARGNTLLKSLGDGSFADVSVASAVNLGRWAWGSSFVDLNNDGWEDLVVANGYLTMADTGDL